jgi:pantothenate kinase
LIKISTQKTVKIELDNLVDKFSPDIVGIDIGQSLTKIAYSEKNEVILTLYQTNSNFLNINEFLEKNKDRYKTINFTGGKAYDPYKKYSSNFKTNLINEFETNIAGLEFLYKCTKSKPIPPSIVVTLGTGTSVVLKTDVTKHLGGSAMGGGFFMGLIRLIFRQSRIDYSDAIDLAKKGNRYQVDLKVADIYNIEDKRVDKLFREFTAASLGKITKDVNADDVKKENIIVSLIGSIGENIGIIATLMAKLHDVKNVIFCGGFLIENKPLKQTLSLICKYNGTKPIFLENSVFAGSIGALSFKN